MLPSAASILFTNLPTPTTTTIEPSSTLPGSASSPGQGSKAANTGAIADIAIGAVVGVILVLVLIFYMKSKRRRSKRAPQLPESVIQPTIKPPGKEADDGPTPPQTGRDTNGNTIVLRRRNIGKIFRELFVDSYVIT